MRLIPSMRSPIAIGVLSVAAALAAQTPVAQAAAAPAQPGATPKSPIDITSDQAETHSADCSVVWTGSPEALRDTSRLRADIMIGHMEILKKAKPGAKPAAKPAAPAVAGAAPAASSSDCGDLLNVEAKGNVYYASPDGRRVHGDNAFYDAVTKIITVTGDVTTVDGQNVMRGTKAIYNTDTGEGHMEGSGKGPGAKNRPRGVFYPKDAKTDDQAASTTPGAAAPAAPAAKPKKKKAAQPDAAHDS
jgi:lipopolysaccharide export system protein LptA